MFRFYSNANRRFLKDCRRVGKKVVKIKALSSEKNVLFTLRFIADMNVHVRQKNVLVKTIISSRTACCTTSPYILITTFDSLGISFFV